MITRMRRIVSSLALMVFAGCATLPAGPSVRVLPGEGKPFEQFQADDAVCRQWAGQSIGVSPQETVNMNAASGAVIGTAVGAGLGAAIGAASGNAGTGAAIGAGSDFLSGLQTVPTPEMHTDGKHSGATTTPYVQCMYAKGNQVPGTVRSYRPRRPLLRLRRA